MTRRQGGEDSGKDVRIRYFEALSILGPRAVISSSDLRGSKVLAKQVLQRFVAANSSGTC